VASRDPFTRWPVLGGMLPHRPRRHLPALPHLPGRAAPAATVSWPAGGRGAGRPRRRPSRGRRRPRRRGGRGASRCMVHSPRLTRAQVPSTTMATIHTARMLGSLARSRFPQGVGCPPRPWLPAESGGRGTPRVRSFPTGVAPRPAGGPTGRDAAARLPSRQAHHPSGYASAGPGHHQPASTTTSAHHRGSGGDRPRCGAARENPAPARGPAGCLPVGLPPGRRPRQGAAYWLRSVPRVPPGTACGGP
jgi:hypothetical protein